MIRITQALCNLSPGTIAGRRSRLAALVAMLGMAYCGSAVAEPISMTDDAEPATLIAFKAEPKLGEFVGRAEGTVDADGKRLFLKGLNVMAPLIIRVFAKDPDKPIDVSLHRFFWQEANREGTTNEDGDWGYSGRVHDELGIALKADAPSEYYVLAWMGPEIDMAPRSPLFVPAQSVAGRGDDSAAAGSGGVPAWALISIIALLVIIATILLRNRVGGGSTAAMILGAALVIVGPGVAAASTVDSFPARLARAESNIDDIFRDITWLRDQRWQIDRSIDALRGGLGDVEARVESINDNLTAINDEAQAGIERVQNEMRGADGAMNARIDRLDESVSRQEMLNEAFTAHINQLYLLVDADRVAEPDPTFGGVPPMPSSCFDNPACSGCFNAVNTKFNEQMALYEKLRSIYATNRSYAEYIVMTGDALSGYHQLEQAAWYGIKLTIKQAQENVTRAYNDKFAEFNQKTDGLLREFGRCEAMAGNRDWYQRHGVLFLNSLVNAYRVHNDTQLPF